MGFQRKKKAKKIWTKQELDWIDQKLNAYKKWHRPISGMIVCKRDGSSQEVVYTARYYTKDDLKADAERTIASLNELDKDGHWKLLSCEITGEDKTEDDDEEQKESKNQED